MKRVPRTYFHLVVRQSGKWSPQFGDYERECVEQERLDTYLASRSTDNEFRFAAKDIKIVRGWDTQEWINDWIHAANNGRIKT